MTFGALPATAAWRHTGAREGFESVFLRDRRCGCLIAGHTTAVEEGRVWAVRYVIELDEHWRTRAARVWRHTADGESELRLDLDLDLAVDGGRWHVNGSAAPDLDGCVDVDLESSACTNTVPVHRLGLGVGQSADAPAVYVRALDLDVARLDQVYARTGDDGGHQTYDYRSPGFDFECRLVYDDAGLILEYPGIANRVA